VQSARLFSFCALSLLAATILSCELEPGDPHSNNGLPPPEGRDARLREILDPASESKAEHDDAVAVSGVVVVAVDTFDETGNGRSRGAVYVQDVGSQEPYSGIGLFAPTFVPGNLRVGAGDVLDLRGQYSEITSIGTVEFPEGAVLSQLFRPTATFRYEFRAPDPVEIDIRDLANFATGRRWLGMLVKVKNVTVHEAVARDELFNGRLSTPLLPPDGDTRFCGPFPQPPTLVNELFDVAALDVPAGTTFKSITGVVTYFCNLHLAPRSLADIER
jgi:hypothetical protein